MASFTNTISAEIAVLNRIPSKSSVTFLMHVCSVLSCAGVPGTSWIAALKRTSASSSGPAAPARVKACSKAVSLASSTSNRHTRPRKRYTPSTPCVFHGFTISSGPMNISYSRNASAP